MLGATTDGDVVILELQREERRNALNLELCREIHAGVDQAVDGGARAIVITGQGTAFCAGADLGGVYGDDSSKRSTGCSGDSPRCRSR